ncbi:hypothetical protein CTZ27_08570 [Streptomyces griseocarneus]|nr:hypothetical protein CTZ27_08570 [Streptomyces griseocarneus]
MQQGNPQPRRRRQAPITYAPFANHRALLLGILGTVAGVVGTVDGFSTGAGVLEILGFIGIGILGLALAVGYIVVVSKRPPYRARRR